MGSYRNGFFTQQALLSLIGKILLIEMDMVVQYIWTFEGF